MDVIALDFETYYDSKFSLTKMTTMEYVKDERFKVWGVGIKINDGDTEWYGEDEVEVAISEIDWRQAAVVCHNTPFDGYILTQYYKVTPKYYIDTAAMSRGLFPGQSARLKDCAVRAFPDDETMRKGEELADAKGIYDLDPDLEAAIAGYCIQDVDLTHAIYSAWAHKMPQSEMDLIDITCRMFCEAKLTVDRESLTAFRDENIKASENAIAESGTTREVLASNKKFVEFLEGLEITPPMKRSPTTGEMIPALGKNDRGYQQMCKMYPQYNHIWRAREACKSRINETRAQRFLDATQENGTIPVPLRYYAAHTGRFGGTEKLNMQNMPRGGHLRKCITSPPGQFVYVADLSNIEARMLAWLAGEDELVEQFRNGEDIYSNFASTIYGRPVNKHKDPTKRFVGKTAILGLGYGMGAKKFRSTLESGAMGPPMQFSEEEATNVVNTYRTTYPGIQLLWQKLELKLINSMSPVSNENWRCLSFADRKIGLPNGLALHYNNLRYDEHNSLVYDSRNKEYTWGGRITENVVQALSRLIVTDAMLRIDRDKYLNASVVLTVHDEIVLLASDTDPDGIMKQVISHMCTPPCWAPDIPLDAEGGYDVRYSK